MTNYDVAIIGNGILALSTALSLLSYDQNIKIAIIGKDTRTGCASNAAGAMLNYIGEVTSETLKNPYSTKKLEISIASGRLWSEWLLQINTLLPANKKLKQNDGTFVILNSKSGSLDTDNYLSIIEAANHYGEEFEEINPREVKGLKPIEDCRPLRALYLPNEGSINSKQLMDALTQILFQFDNVDFIDDNITNIEIKKNSINSVSANDGNPIYAGKFLLAAGSYSQAIIDQIPPLASRIPRLLSGVGISAVISQNGVNNVQHVIRTPNRSGACGLHALPRDQNSLYIGATNNIAFSPSTEHKLGLTQFLLKCAIDQIDQDLYNSEILNWHVGNRPVTVDTFPLVGKTSVENLYILTGTYRDGLQQSPFWGDYMAKLICEKEPDFDHPFAPERKLLSTLPNKKTAINNVVQHYMAGFYEHGMELARLFPARNMEQLLTTKFEKIYEMLDTEYPLVPDILFLFELSDANDKNIAYFKQYFKNQTFIATDFK